MYEELMDQVKNELKLLKLLKGIPECLQYIEKLK